MSDATIDKISQLTCMDAPMIRRLARMGYFPGPNKSGEFDVPATIRGCFKYCSEERTKRGRPTEGSNSLPVYNSMKECESATGIPQVVQKQAKAEGCDGFRFNRVALGQLLPFLFKDRKDTQASASISSPTLAVRSELDLWKARREKFKFEKESQTVISKQLMREGLHRARAEYYSALERAFCMELPPILVGLDAHAIREKCKTAVVEMKNILRLRFDQITQEEQDAQMAVGDTGRTGNGNSGQLGS